SIRLRPARLEEPVSSGSDSDAARASGPQSCCARFLRDKSADTNWRWFYKTKPCCRCHIERPSLHFAPSSFRFADESCRHRNFIRAGRFGFESRSQRSFRRVRRRLNQALAGCTRSIRAQKTISAVHPFLARQQIALCRRRPAHLWRDT
ncbi:hypothetical protein SPRG_19378, partial [Saprolegnia parasitica CBS 223.65]